jgi:hypothetical protein
VSLDCTVSRSSRDSASCSVCAQAVAIDEKACSADQLVGLQRYCTDALRLGGQAATGFWSGLSAAEFIGGSRSSDSV